MDDIYNEINKIEYLFIKDCQLIIEDIPVELFNESNNNKLCKILDILYSLKDKINNKLIIDFIFETKDEKEIPKKISFYQYILLSFYTFINIYFNQRQFIIIRFPQIFQVNDNHQIINFDYKIKLNLLNNIISFNDKEFTKYIKSNNELLSKIVK